VQKVFSPLLQIGLCTFGYLYATSEMSLAQVTTDGTVNTQVIENGNVAEITGGETRGSNLFHSFQEFSVGTGNEAFFNNANNISNIFSRVTGGKISSIDGLIRANGSANLFLINPAGIIFGEGARLDIGGSFYGSSASSVLFEDGEFSAVDLENPPVLTINAPIGLNFRDNPAPIDNNSKADADFNPLPSFDDGKFGLRVPDGKTFALAGGDITANGGGIVAFGGQIELAAIGGEGTLGLTSNGDNFSFSFSENLPRANVSLTNQAGFLVAAGGGGDISITGKNITIDNSSFDAGILSKLGSTEAQAGDIKFNSSEALTIANNSTIQNSIFLEAFGNAGNIDIQTKTLNVNNSQVSSVIYDKSKGTSGNLTVKAFDSINLSGEIPGENGNLGFPGGLLAQADFGAEGQSGNINIETNRLNISNGSKIQAATFGDGNAGNLTIRASEINVFNTPDANNYFSTVINTGVSVDPRNVNLPKGNGGNLTIETDQLSIRNGGQVNANTQGEGNAGDLSVKATNLVDIKDEGSAITTTVASGAKGKGGNLTIETGSLKVSKGADILTDTFGDGDAGKLQIKATDSVEVSGEGTYVSADVNQDATGNGGSLTIDTGNLIVRDGAFVSASTYGDGNAGNIIVNANGAVNLDGTSADGQFASAIYSFLNTGATGKAGNIDITADSLSLTNGVQINSSTYGNGDGGNVIITAKQLSVRDGAGLGTDTFSAGKAGNLTINVENFTVQNSQVSASTLGKGNAGNLTVNASESVELSGEFLDENGNPIGPGGLLAQSDLDATGKGGNLTVETQRLSISNGSKIQAATFNNGDAGEIEIRASEIDLFNTPNANNQFPTEISAGSIRDVQGRNANSPLKGNGGSVTIEAERLSISNGARINVRSDGQGNSGSLNLETSNLNLSDRAEISASTASNEGGNINLKIDDTLTMRNNSLISAQALKNADGGNIDIDTNFIVAFPNQINGNGSDIIASAAEGDGGRITINAESLLGIKERKAEGNNQTNDIDASSKFGLDGTVSIFTPDINPVQGATELPSNVVEPEKTTTQTCQANRDGTAKNGLTIKGKGGVPPAPDLPLNSQNISINGEIDPTISTIPEPIETSLGKIQPARGIKVTKDGRVILTAYRTNNAGERIPEIKPNCN
jgi:filamentous hemagglutinin family protein